MGVARVLIAAAGAFVVFAGATALVAAADPSPVPSPTTASVLPEIGSTRATTPFCAMVRDNVAPAIVGLMTFDELLVASRGDYRRMAGESHAAQNFSRIRLGNSVIGMAHHLAIVRGFVDDEKRFPLAAVTDNDRLAMRLHAQLQAVADRQDAALNTVNGVLETDLLHQMMGGIPHVPQFGISRHFYHAVADVLGAQQTKVAEAEAELAPTVIAVAAACGVARPAPSPATAATPQP